MTSAGGCGITSRLGAITFCVYLTAFLGRGRRHPDSLSPVPQAGAPTTDCWAFAGGTLYACAASCPAQRPGTPGTGCLRESDAGCKLAEQQCMGCQSWERKLGRCQDQRLERLCEDPRSRCVRSETSQACSYCWDQWQFAASLPLFI